MKFLYFPLIFLFLSSCARLDIYDNAVQGDKAKLIFPAAKSSYQLLGGFSGSSTMFAIAKENGCGRFFRPMKSEETDIENIIPANRNILLNTGFLIGNSSCNLTVYFKSEKDHEYRVTPSLRGKSCGILVFDKTKNKAVEIKYAKLNTWDAKSACIKS